MTDTEILEAMRQMLEPINLKLTNLDNRLSNMDNRISNLDNRITNLISTHSAHEDGDSNTTQKTNNSSSHFHNQITSYPLKSPPTYPAHIQNRSHCAVFPVRIPP